MTTSNHITIQECGDSNLKIKLVQTPETLENGGQVIVDDRKELNLGIAKELCHIYVSSLPML